VRLALIGCVAAAALLAAGHFRNFGGFLSIWDWLFGTAYCPSNREVPAFGIDGVEPSTHYRDHLMMPLGSLRLAKWNFDHTPPSNPDGGL